MNDNTLKNQAGQIASTSHGTSTALPQKPLPPRKQQAIRLIKLYEEIKKTGVIPEQETYTKELGDLAPDLDELTRQYQIDGIPGMHEAFITLARNNKYVGWAAASASPAQQEGKPQEEPARKRTLINLAELRNRPRPKWVIEGYIYENTILYLYAEAGCYKSFLSFDWAARIATGTDWLGRVKTHKRGKVIYIAAEGADGYIARADAWCAYYGVDFTTLAENFYFWPEALPLTNAAEVTRFIEEVTEILAGEENAPQFVVIDTLLRCSNGENINLPDIMGSIFNGAARIKSALNIPNILIVHHAGKDTARGGMGSTVLRDNCDCEYYMKKDLSNPGQVELIAKKMKDRPELSVTLQKRKVYYTDALSEEEASLVLVEAEETEKRIEIKPLPDSQRAILEIIEANSEVSYTDLWNSWSKDNLKGRSKQNFTKILKMQIDANIIEKMNGKYRLYVTPQTETQETLEEAATQGQLEGEEEDCE